MRKVLEKINTIHKMHHFYLIVLVSPVLMWLLSGIVSEFRVAGSGGQFAMFTAWFLGQAIAPILLGIVILIFGRPSSAWVAVIVAALCVTYVVHRSESRAAQASLSYATGQAPNNSFKPNLLRYTNNMAGKACHVVGSAT